ncbi:MAG TPA: hypothetical protein DCM08_06820 [Microscillaceae bacterium]|jgi:hypothetical protein|nr:hypothetical protein [Microscillaceae bacterium]
MLVPFDTLPTHAQVWIYQANRALSDAETTIVNQTLGAFCQTWDSHQQPVQAGFALLHNRFIALAANEEMTTVSGCGIDKSVAQMRALAQQLQVDFFDRSQVAFWQNDTVQTYLLAQLAQAIEKGAITAESLVFNNHLKTLGEWQNQWLQPAAQSWMARYFKQPA